MAQKCSICGAEVNVFQSQKLADGNYICRKTCRSKGLKDFDYIHASLTDVVAHLSQVERGTKLWQHYFIPRRKTKNKAQKLKKYYNVTVAPDIGLFAYVETRYKIFIFGKMERACVFRIADLYEYDTLVEDVKNSDGKTVKKYFVHCFVRNTPGLSELKIKCSGIIEANEIIEYFDKLFGINSKTIRGKFAETKNQIKLAGAIAGNVKDLLNENSNEADKMKIADDLGQNLDSAKYGDRSKWIKLADDALAAFPG